MGVLLDSSVLIHFERSGEDLATYVEGREEEEIFLSVISASELLHGVHRTG
jgi:predicted nucleic acid-binding protein